MDQAVSPQHPPVVLRSHFNWLRAMLVIAVLAVVALAAALVVVATEDNGDAGTATATPVNTRGPSAIRYDGGPEEGTAALIQRSAPATFDPNSIKSAPGVRYDGGPEEGSRGAGR